IRRFHALPVSTVSLGLSIYSRAEAIWLVRIRGLFSELSFQASNISGEGCPMLGHSPKLLALFPRWKCLCSLDAFPCVFAANLLSEHVTLLCVEDRATSKC